MKHKYKEQDITLSAKVLISLFVAFEFLPRPFEGKTAYFRRQLFGHMPYRTYLKIMKRLEEKGLLKIYKDAGKGFIQLEKPGVLKALFAKTLVLPVLKWDGKWSIVIFDIPEEAKDRRKQIRVFLRANGFRLIQKSVYISPHPFNKDAVAYLKLSGLLKYIRVFRAEKLDDDADLKQIFKLNK